MPVFLYQQILPRLRTEFVFKDAMLERARHFLSKVAELARAKWEKTGGRR